MTRSKRRLVLTREEVFSLLEFIDRMDEKEKRYYNIEVRKRRFNIAEKFKECYQEKETTVCYKVGTKYLTIVVRHPAMYVKLPNGLWTWAVIEYRIPLIFFTRKTFEGTVKGEVPAIAYKIFKKIWS